MIQTTQVEPSFPVQISQEEISVVELPKLSTEQQSFVQQVFENQQKEKMYLFQKLQQQEKLNHQIEDERTRYRQTMLRHAAALSFSIIQKFMSTINNSPDLQAMLDIKPKSKEPIKLDILIEKMEKLLREETPPRDFTDEKEMEEWTWCKRGVEQSLQPVVDDIKVFFKTFGVDNLKAHCPDILEKDLEEQIRIALNPTPEGTSKLEMAGIGLKYTFYALYYMCVILKTPSIYLLRWWLRI